MDINIKTALISVYHKENIDNIVKHLTNLAIKIISTGGTKEYIEKLGYEVTSVESLTNYPSLFNGRIKTLHPSIMGGILFNRDEINDLEESKQYQISQIDLVIVDLYPFEQTLKQTQNADEIIEKIDIGGISLIRAAAKNYKHVLVIPSENEYKFLIDLLVNKNGISSISDRKYMASKAFEITTNYDRIIYQYFNELPLVNIPTSPITQLRYGENPHQKAWYIGNFDNIFDKIQGQDISYNNLLDIDASINLIQEFDEPTIAILKHNNACGVASSSNIILAWHKALEADPISAFGGIIVSNLCITEELAVEINKLFFEILIAPSFENQSLKILSSKQKRIILKQKAFPPEIYSIKTALNGVLIQEKDLHKINSNTFKVVTEKHPSIEETEDLIFANKIVKHTKSNAIVITKNKQLLGSGTGQTSRIDAVKNAIEKAHKFNFNLSGAVLASDAFFPFSDSIELAYNAGITSFIQPGGSIRDSESINFCNQKKLSMIFSNFRHFKH